ncbi:uncharacterized protein EI90DRAFT_3035737 [Cantharellus anzutake]|uniref:uncharacterized protein n=1 Tax=Cantharellus anzutake TaxID=1750568 RepID=UPI001902FF64|nr:uncharacterized protein EI90DRAFT_3035737 [Cantharellus anzutake]KAF8340485.1 hypothetical protein EI90DRAFT_3035737 [Cantharellus anzutake]
MSKRIEKIQHKSRRNLLLCVEWWRAAFTTWSAFTIALFLPHEPYGMGEKLLWGAIRMPSKAPKFGISPVRFGDPVQIKQGISFRKGFEFAIFVFVQGFTNMTSNLKFPLFRHFLPSLHFFRIQPSFNVRVVVVNFRKSMRTMLSTYGIRPPVLRRTIRNTFRKADLSKLPRLFDLFRVNSGMLGSLNTLFPSSRRAASSLTSSVSRVGRCDTTTTG